MRPRTLLLLATLGGWACEVRPSEQRAPSRETPEPLGAVAKPAAGDELARWESVYGEMRQARSCFRQELMNCPADPVLLDELIGQAITDQLDGDMPQDEAGWDRVAQTARRTYREWMASDEGLAEVEALVRARFHAPTTHRDASGMVVIDLGLSPVVLRSYVRSTSIQVAEGLLLDRGELQTDEILRHLEAHRDEPEVIQVVVVIPETSSWTTFRYRWIKGQDRIAVTRDDRPNQAWLTDPLGGELSVSSVHTSDLDLCYPGQQMLPQTPTVDCPL